MIQMKQIDWTSGHIPSNAVDSGCRVVASEEEMKALQGQPAGTLVYCSESHMVYTVTKEGFEAVTPDNATDEEIVKMFVAVTGEDPKIDLSTKAIIKMDDGTLATETTSKEIAAMFPEEEGNAQ